MFDPKLRERVQLPTTDNRLLLAALSPAVGRDTERAALLHRIHADPAWLHTVVGPVGVGKSRLALAVATDFAHAGGTVAAFVDVSGATDPGPALAEAADADDRVLVVLDGCDEIDAADLDTLARAVRAHPGLRVLATAREPLRLAGESLFRLGPLPIPPADAPVAVLADNPSVALFLRIAAAARPGFVLTAENREAIAAICRRLDGLPMAIECAAQALTVLQPASVLARLREGLEVLDSACRGGGPCLSGALAGHIGRLPPATARLLERLAVFEAGFAIESVEAVSGASPAETQRQLAVLVDRSLVQVDEQWDWSVRLSLATTTRAFLQARRGPAARAETAVRLAEHYLTVVTDGRRAIDGPDGDVHLRMLAAEQDDVEAAVRYFLSTGRRTEALRLAAGLTGHWINRGDPATGLAWLEQALAAHDPADPGAELAALDAAGVLAGRMGRHALAWERHESAYALARTAGPGDRQALKLALTGVRGGQPTGSLVHLAAAPAAGGDPQSDLDIATFRLAQGIPAAARGLAASARAAFCARQDAYGVAAADALLAEIAVVEKDPSAEALCRDVLVAVRAHDPCGVTARCAEMLAAACGSGMPVRARWAVQLLGAAQRRRETTHLAAAVPRATAIRSLTAKLQAELGPAMYADLWTAGYETPIFRLLDEPADPQIRGDAVSKLTPRQREVAHLIGYGLTNREIARRLGVAEWTAVNHVRQVLRKLQCSSRVQVARLVVQDEARR